MGWSGGKMVGGGGVVRWWGVSDGCTMVWVYDGVVRWCGAMVWCEELVYEGGGRRSWGAMVWCDGVPAESTDLTLPTGECRSV